MNRGIIAKLLSTKSRFDKVGHYVIRHESNPRNLCRVCNNNTLVCTVTLKLEMQKQPASRMFPDQPHPLMDLARASYTMHTIFIGSTFK